MDAYKLPQPPKEWLARKEEGQGKNWKPYVPYLRMEDAPKFVSMHWGQRKLFLTEIMFFAMHGQPDTKIVYAGAAPGQHTEYLSNLFPTYHFDLVDPEKWNDKFVEQYPQLGQAHKDFSDVVPQDYIISPEITVWHGYFTDELAHRLGKAYANDNVLFISDIRPTEIEQSKSLEERNAVVVENMEMQKRWYNIINSYLKTPAWGMFKFKVNFDVPTTTYLRGDVYYQPWAPLVSPELRLITNARESDPLEVYDNKWIEQHLRWYNEVKRNELLKTVRHKDLNALLDTQYEYDIFDMFVKQDPERQEQIELEREDRQAAIVKQMVLGLMTGLSKHLEEQGMGSKDRRGKYNFEAGYQVNPRKQEKDVRRIVEKNIKYTQGEKVDEELDEASDEKRVDEKRVDERRVYEDEYKVTRVVKREELYSVITNLADIPLDFLVRYKEATSITYDQLQRGVATLLYSANILDRMTRVFVDGVKLLFVDLSGSNVNGVRYIGAKLVLLYLASGEKNEVLAGHVKPFDMQMTLAESVISIDRLAMILGLDFITDASRYFDGKKTYVYAYKQNPARIRSLINKITEMDLTEQQVKQLFKNVDEDLTILLSIPTRGTKHEVKAEYKLAGLERMFKQFNLDVNAILFPAPKTAYLDFGGGVGDLAHAYLELAKARRKKADAYVVDIANWATKKHEGKYSDVHYSWVDTKVIPFGDGMFDFVTMIQVLHHIDDPMFALQELYRVMKDDAYMFIREHDCQSLEDHVVINMEHMIYDVTIAGSQEAYYNYRAYYFSYERLQTMLASVGFVVRYRTDAKPPSNSYYMLVQKTKERVTSSLSLSSVI
jgi:ubiquinone/menaquinone biosynthesis C-methylase UbiE